MSFQNALEDLNAMILAADPCDPTAVAQLGIHVEELLAAVQPALPETEVLSLVLSTLRSAGSLETAAVLRIAASAIAELSQQSGGENAACQAIGPASSRTPETAASGERSNDASWAAATVEVDAELLAEFIAESHDRIALAEAATLLLERNPLDAEAINTVLRAFHTIKGGSGLLGLTQIQQLAHHAESLLIRGRDGDLKMVSRHIDLALKSCDALKFMVDSLENQKPGHQPAVPNSYQVLVEALIEHEQTGVIAGLASPDEALPIEGDAEWAADSIRLPAAAGAIDDLFLESDADEPNEKPVVGLRPQGSAAAAPALDASVRVNTHRLDNLANLVGELVIAQAIVAQDSRAAGDNTSRLARSVGVTGKITRQLQDLAMSLRMVPLKGTFQKMARLVRDLAHKSDKEVHFHILGEDTEIDRNMVEALCDPLAHMIRNAVDHGIERAADRVARGKSPRGTLILRAYHAAGNVVIELEDDGRGLDRERILRQAIHRGLVEPESPLSDEEVHFLIFQPGLSTAENVTEISGRGVGLDVVKRNVESLRGRIEVATNPGEGTLFTLRLPLTTAIIDAMSVRVGEQNYLLPTVVIERSFRPEAGSVSSVVGRGEMIMHHGQMLPLFRLHRLFNVADAQQDPQHALVIVIEGGGKRCAVMVDELLGQQQAVMKSLENSLFKVPGVAGGAILSDGRVGLILDAAGLVQLAHGGREDSQRAAAETEFRSPRLPTEPISSSSQQDPMGKT